MFGKRALSCSDCAIITFAVFLYFFLLFFLFRDLRQLSNYNLPSVSDFLVFFYPPLNDYMYAQNSLPIQS